MVLMIAEINGINIFYEKSGKGKPLILLHGNGEDHSIFDVLSTMLRDNYTVYAVDSRNHGKSEKTDDYTYGQMARDISAFVDLFGLEGAAVLGFSDGAIIAVLAQLQNPGIFSSMILLGINLKPSDLKPEIYDYLKKEYDRTGNPLTRMMVEQPSIEIADMESIQVRTLLVAAEDDLCPAEFYERLAEKLPCSEFITIQGHDHGSYIINNDMLYPAVKEFLAGN